MLLLITMMLSFYLFMQDKSIQPLISLWDNSFMKKTSNFYAMARNMKKFYSLEPNTLLKVMMKSTPAIYDEGPTIIAVNKHWMWECLDKESNIYKLEVNKRAKF